MSRRVVVVIDQISHINDVTFRVYRSSEPGVDDADLHLMDVFDPATIKEGFTQETERLIRDEETPYAFHVERHFSTVPFPTVYIGSTPVPQENVTLFPEQKMIEIQGSGLGVGDTRHVYMTYEYQGIPVRDNYPPQSGVTYYGPPATGLRPPVNVGFTHLTAEQQIRIAYDADLTPVIYYYRIQAMDSDGNVSPYSKEHNISVIPDTSELLFIVERSQDGEQWEEVTRTPDLWMQDDIFVTTPPLNLQNVTVTPISSKESRITLDNPWYHYTTQPRSLWQYRIRVIDTSGEVSEYITISDPGSIFLKPKEVVIRRKLDNGTVSSPTGTDAIDVFRLTEADIDITQPTLTLIDNQLTDESIYAYTFFLTDEISMEAAPFYQISDHTGWDNIILFSGDEVSYPILVKDSVTSFQWK